jgi:peptidoglycan hydrolase-like protein with peptidoglycan-binding domain
MAHKEYTTNAEVKKAASDGRFSHFWNINKEVGWGCRNDSDDVLLVQYFLVASSDKYRQANLVLDGIFGKKTAKAIREFQNYFDIFSDGKIDVPDGSRLYIYNSSGNGYAYTMLCLNYCYYYKKPVFYEDPRMDSKLPSELCQVFSSWKNE